MMEAPLIVCVGTAVLDQIYRVDALPGGAGKHFAAEYREVGGGPAANAAVTVARLGGRAALWARVGADMNGARIIEELASAGIDVAGVQPVPGAQSGVSAVIVDRCGERMIVNHRDPKLELQAQQLAPEGLGGADAVLADLRWGKGVAQALGTARSRGIPAVLDADIVPQQADEAAYRAATHVLFSEPALARYAGSEDLQEGLRAAAGRLDAWVGVTAGARGSFWIEDGRIEHMPAWRVEAIDTLAAGDVFHGAFALALARGENEAAALLFATAAAALKCTRFGGRDGIPDAADLARFMTEAAA